MLGSDLTAFGSQLQTDRMTFTVATCLHVQDVNALSLLLPKARGTKWGSTKCKTGHDCQASWVL